MKRIILSLLVVAALTSCKSYGKKVLTEGVKGEVYYKGDGITEADAQKLGTYLKEQNYFNNTEKQSVQISKGKDGAYEIRFVVNEDKLKANPGIAQTFQQMGAGLSIEVYNNVPVNIYFTDSHDKTLQSLPFSKEVANQLQQMLDKAKQDAAPQDSMSTTPVEDSATHTDQ